MGEFYKSTSYRKVRRFLKKKGFQIRDGKHMIARHPEDKQIIISVPRHNSLSKGVSEEICKKLIELGYKKTEIRKKLF